MCSDVGSICRLQWDMCDVVGIFVQEHMAMM